MILQKLLSIFNKIIPKKNYIIFNSFPAYDDNSFFVYDYIYNNRQDIKKKYKLVWAQEKSSLIPETIKSRKDTIIVDKYSLSGIYKFLRAKYVFSTHGYFINVHSGKHQKQINLWHGVGFKSITEEDHFYRGDYTIATSPIYQKIQSKVLDIRDENVLITGLPKADALFKSSHALEKIGIDKKAYVKIFIWMPTYRKAKSGNSKAGHNHDSIDGKVDGFNVASLGNDGLIGLNKALFKVNALLIIKPHPMDSFDLSFYKENSNIKIMTNEYLQENNVQLYELLADTDCLLSDYSSVVVDYLLLDKPIALVMSDIEEYKNTRGFVFDNIEDYFAGPILSNLDELLSYIENSEPLDKKWEAVRRKITNEFHTYRDGNNSQRVVEKFFEKMEDVKE